MYMCHIIGMKGEMTMDDFTIEINYIWFNISGAGKTSLCRAFLSDDMKKLTDKDLRGYNQHCINSVQVYGQDKYLILRDIDVRQVLDPLQPAEVLCDVACLTYDISDPKSFEYIARIYIKYFAESKIPVMVVGCKGDREEVRQDYLLQPAEFCAKYKLLPPQYFSIKHNKKDIYTKLTTMASFP